MEIHSQKQWESSLEYKEFFKSFFTQKGNKERGTDGPSWLFHPSLKIQLKKKSKERVFSKG